jgi:hypothetical protein
MSEVKVNKISPRTNCGTVQLGDSGDTITIPAGATIVNNGTQTGFGRTGTVNWDTTAKTSSFTAVSGNGYFVNTTSGAITVTLPAGSAGDIVAIADYANTFDTNALTIAPNGSDKIGGTNANATVSTEGASTTFVYVDSTQGWKQVNDATLNTIGQTFIVATGGTITTCGDCKIHTFTGPGTFCVSSLATCAGNNVVSHVVVAGGASGRYGIDGAGGGGAGGFREAKSAATTYTASPLDGGTPNTITVTASPYPISVGGGGSAPVSGAENGQNGSNSVFSTVTSTGGGGGGQFQTAGSAGGSGGGGGGRCGNAGGAGNTPPVVPAQGNPGGPAKPQSSPSLDSGGGGGGATTPGGAGENDGSPAGRGGTGVSTQITGSVVSYAGGGGGSRETYTKGAASPCGTGGAGGQDTLCQAAGGNGTTNRGGGGGGGTPAGSGGSGVVIIRYRYQ